MDQLINKGKNILKSTISYDVLYAKDGYSILPVSIKHLSIRLPKSWEVFISPDLVIEQARNNGWCIVEGEDDFLKVLA